MNQEFGYGYAIDQSLSIINSAVKQYVNAIQSHADRSIFPSK